MDLRNGKEPKIAEFPSPIGELHFSIYINVTICRKGIYIVSVPYRGATFLNGRMNSKHCHQRLFPSPIGELHFSIRIQVLYSISIQSFRPLSGSYISQSGQHLVFTHHQLVSVPYRGATFLNKFLKQ